MVIVINYSVALIAKGLLIIDPFIPTNMNFQTILMPKVNLAKTLSVKSWSVRTILNFSMQ